RRFSLPDATGQSDGGSHPPWSSTAPPLRSTAHGSTVSAACFHHLLRSLWPTPLYKQKSKKTAIFLLFHRFFPLPRNLCVYLHNSAHFPVDFAHPSEHDIHRRAVGDFITVQHLLGAQQYRRKSAISASGLRLKWVRLIT